MKNEKQKKKILVVGGGMSGLITSAYLSKNGLAVTLIEKNDECGGLVSSFIRDGFLFDGGIRAIENAGMILPMIKELDIDLEMLESKISLGIENDIIHVETDESLLDYEKQLKRIYPESTQDVDNVVKVIREMKNHMNVLFGSDSPFFKDKKRDRWYFIKGLLPWLFKLIGTVRAIMKMQIPVEDFLEKIIKNRSLHDIISQHFFIKTPAFFAMSYFALYIDYYYPRGGTGQLPKKIKEALLEYGGEFLPDTDITAVDFIKKSVTDQNGSTYNYDKLIWAADLKQLYRIVSLDDLESRISTQIEDDKKKILGSKGAESVFSVFMAVDMDPEIFRGLSHGHFFFTPSKDGLNDIQRGELREMLDNWQDLQKSEVLDWADRFCRLNTYEISIPVLNDPDTAPPGKTGVIVSCLLDHALVKKLEETGWYDEFVDFMKQKIIIVLDGSVYPGLKETLLFSFAASPLAIEKKVRSSEGAIVGWSFDQPIPVKGGMLNMKKAVRTSFPDIFKVGQWAGSPAGLPTCILTAKLAANIVEREL